MEQTVLVLIFTLGYSVSAGYQGYSSRSHPLYSPYKIQERQNNQQISYPMSPQSQKQYQVQPQLQPYKIESQRQQPYPFEPHRQQHYRMDPQYVEQYRIEPQYLEQNQIQPQYLKQYQIDPKIQQQYRFDPQRQQQYRIDPQSQQQYQIDPQRQQQYQIDPKRQHQYQIDPKRQHQFRIDQQAPQQYQIAPERQLQYPIRQYPQYQQQNEVPIYPSQYRNQISPYVAQYQQQNQPPNHVDASSQMIDAPESPMSKQVLSTTNDMMQSVPVPHLKYDQQEAPILEFGSNSGFQKNRGDKAAQRGEFPYHVQIREHGKFICCGSLVRSPITGKHVIITATHCLVEKGTSKLASAKDYEVRVDVLDREDFGQRRKVKQLLVHPGYVVSRYRSRPLYNDIGIMILEADFEENQFVIPIALPTTYGPTIWNTVTVTGWGKGRESGHPGLSNVLRVVEMGVWDSKDCNRIYHTESGRNVVTDAQFCAGAIEGGLDACQGDSGGPAITLDKGRPYLSGIVAWGKGCGLGQYPGLYTRVWSYKDWIKNTLYDYEINGMLPPPPEYPQ